MIRLSERRFVTRQETEKLLEACPNHDWRTIVALARFGGLRCPSEVLSLRWQDIDWDGKRIIVPSPKTAHHGKETRIIPLFPELKVALDDAWEMAPEGAVYVVDEKYRLSANSKTGWRNCNLRTTFKKIVERAGLKPWPKLFHALRSSRETELAREYPIHVVTAWLGNTPSIALKHYLMTTDEDFERAACGESTDVEPEKPASENVPEVGVQKAVQYGAERGRSARQAASADVRNTKGSSQLRVLAIGRSGDDRIRNSGQSADNLAQTEAGGADSGALCKSSQFPASPDHDGAILDLDLTAVVDAWPTLPTAIRAAINALIRSAGGSDE